MAKARSQRTCRDCPAPAVYHSQLCAGCKLLCSHCRKAPRAANDSRCKPCHTSMERDRLAKMGRESARAALRRYKAANPALSKMHSKIHSKNYKLKLRGVVGKVYAKDWLAVQAAQDGRCNHCSEPKTLTIDHVIPVTRGGAHLPWNVQGLCMACNQKKRDNMTDADISLINSRPDAVAWLDSEEGGIARAYIASLTLPVAA